MTPPYGPDAYFLGPAQIAWLKRGLMNSQATWKIIAADMALGLIVQYDTDRKWGSEGIAQGDGAPLGRELELADLLSFIKHAGIRNTMWITADVHYTAAHYYDPNKAVFQDFEPFWEFVSGPIHAGTFGPTSWTTPSVRESATSRRQARSRDKTFRPAKARQNLFTLVASFRQYPKPAAKSASMLYCSLDSDVE